MSAKVGTMGPSMGRRGANPGSSLRIKSHVSLTAQLAQNSYITVNIYLETCSLWRFEWKCWTYSSYNTTSWPMRLILPNWNNILESQKQTQTVLVSLLLLKSYFVPCNIGKKKQKNILKYSRVQMYKLTVSVSMETAAQFHALRTAGAKIGLLSRVSKQMSSQWGWRYLKLRNFLVSS